MGLRSPFRKNRAEAVNDEPVTLPAAPPAVSSAPIGFETVLGGSSVIEGRLLCAGNLRLDGVFSGTLETSGNVLVGAQAKITANINAQHISIAGEVRGNIIGQRVQVLRTARIWGDISATKFSTEEGAAIDGKITMREASLEAPTPPPTAEPAADAPPVDSEDANPEQE